MTTIESLRLRALALRSSIHNEQCLSAIELAGMCAKKTNELIAVINDLADYIDSLYLGMDVVYDETTESLVIKSKIVGE